MRSADTEGTTPRSIDISRKIFNTENSVIPVLFMTSSSENSPEAIASQPTNLEYPPKTDAPFPVVGVAASAGGLEAFIDLIRHLPIDTGMAFVLVQHLSPDYESLLSEILGRVTEMPVRQVQDRMRIEPNKVYVIPPKTQMTLVDGMLHLAPRQKILGKYMPGDVFFESLAAAHGNKALAVVLSGQMETAHRG
jgi:two-component system, chemotaxis family, CheB/CheR fusion protein